MTDPSCMPTTLTGGVRKRQQSVSIFQSITDSSAGKETGVREVPLLCYEELLAAEGAVSLFDPSVWRSLAPGMDEREASSMCYTSGTTGLPKGCLYSHRSTVLHTLGAVVSQDGFGISHRDAVLSVVPMFHVNGWGIPCKYYILRAFKRNPTR